MNEGHSAFLALERIRQLLMAEQGIASTRPARPSCAASIFTTHTPGAGRQRRLRALADRPVLLQLLAASSGSTASSSWPWAGRSPNNARSR